MKENKIGIYAFIILIIAVSILVIAWAEYPASAEEQTISGIGNGLNSQNSLVGGGVSEAASQTAVAGGDSNPSESGSSYRTITDMAGRTVTIPSDVSMVLCTSPPPTTFVYMLAPEKLGGWQSTLSDESSKYLSAGSGNLTVLSWGSGTNYEAYIAMNPDLIFVLYEETTDPASVDLVQEKFGTIPVVCVDNARNATEYGPTLTFMGDVLGVPERAEALVAYYQGVLDEVESTVSGIPESERVRVYYAEGANGLSTDPSGSCHSQLIDVCGGINVAMCEIMSGSGMTEVTKESVLIWKPEAIITTSEEFIEQVYEDATWKQLPAVQNGRVYLTPNNPYNWFDRPPGVNRIVGIPWTAHVLYPDLFPEEWFESRVKEFYSLFYHYDLSDEDLADLLAA